MQRTFAGRAGFDANIPVISSDQHVKVRYLVGDGMRDVFLAEAPWSVLAVKPGN